MKNCPRRCRTARAYAERIGLPWPLRPDLETLDRIILAHQCTVPFENLEPYDQGAGTLAGDRDAL